MTVKSRVARHAAIAATVIHAFGSTAFAEDAQQITRSAAAPLGEVSTAVSTSANASGSGNLHMKYSGYFYGPGLGAMASHSQPMGGTDLTLYNSLPVSYDLTSQNYVAVSPRFNYVPVRGHHLDLLDPRVEISRKDVANLGPIKWTLTRAGVEVPISEASRKADRLLTFRFVQGFSYGDSGSRWSIGADIDTRFYAHQGAAADTDIYAYLGVYPSYQISPELVANFNLEMDAAHARGESLGFAATSTYFRPAINWTITQAFNISPYIAVPVFQSLDAADAQVGMELAGTFF